MEKRVLYRTKFNKSIVEGQKYFVVTKNNVILQTIASSRTPEDGSILERFLTRTGAEKFIKNLANKKPERIIPTASEEELAKMDIMKQLDYIDGKEEFSNWLKRNGNIRIFANSNGLILKNSVTTIISFTWSSKEMSCCGAREMRSHSGVTSQDVIKGLTKERLEILVKYLVDDFNSAMKQTFGNYGVVTYVRNPDAIGDASGRIGFLLAASDLFVKTGRFVNPNSRNPLDVYAISDKWYKS